MNRGESVGSRNNETRGHEYQHRGRNDREAFVDLGDEDNYDHADHESETEDRVDVAECAEVVLFVWVVDCAAYFCTGDDTQNQCNLYQTS